ncbi:sugar ABC transporter permease [Paenibacillus sp. PL2-23]|uniref:carbohydrate ABC transporter permease n=1 Tax=Paenibacillus sp. PL2-23 TaxID=2100729 RepID=UPI0030F55182
MQLKLSREHKNLIFAAILILPAILLLIVTIVIPLLQSFAMSLQDYSLLQPTSSWNQFENYTSILMSSEFYDAFGVTLRYVGIAVGMELVLGMIIALVLNSRVILRGFFRSVLMLPWAIPTIVASLIFMWMYQTDYGVFNYLLKNAGLIDENVNWLSSFDFALAAILIVAIWKQTPLMTLMLLAGMQNISRSLYEAARIDGANATQVFFRITLPLLKPVIATVTLMLIVQNFQMFTLFFTLTGGGPVDATQSLAILTYETAFEKYDFGRGSAIGVIWMAVLFIFSIAFTKIMNRGSAH